MGVIALVVIILGLIFFLPRAERRTSRTPTSNTQVSQVDQRDIAIAQLQGEINNLKLRLQECENRSVSGSGTNLGGSTGMGSGSLSMSGPIEMQVSGDMKVSGKLTLTPTGPAQAPKTVQRATPAPKPATQKVVTPAPQQPTQTVVVQAPKASTELVFPSYFYEAGDKAAKFCVRVDGRSDGHLPHLAINDGRISPDDPTVLANSDGGFDWISEKGMPDFVGDWGVVQNNGDIIFFVSAALIELYLQPGSDMVDLNAPATRNVYRRMTKFEDYYVYYVK